MTTSTNNKSFSKRRPILTVVIIEVLLLLAVFAAGAYATIKELEYTAPVLISFIPIALVLIVYLTWKRKWNQMGFQSLRNIPKKNWLYYLPLVVILVVISLEGFRGVTASEVLFFIFFTLLVGFVEETVYRGLILRTLLAKSVTTAVVTSSILFSITHVLNVLSGQSTSQTILQIIYALVMGAVLALLIVKNHNIIPLILFHFIHNLIQFLGNESTFLAYDVLIIVVLVIQCVWLIVSLKGKVVRPQPEINKGSSLV
ncbi:membrane protease YdiL (CAAX protease family) [Paenibacillus sp. DS2015]|uniref:CPBP family intramembrane glutamic endopeptidase n=1 Tax=Paenibacillus sp. DS2015 TaxID=3373917 RepID=UPI003D24C964